MKRFSIPSLPSTALAKWWPQLAGLLVIAVGFWQVTRLTGTDEWLWLGATGVVVLAGFAACDRVRPSRDVPSAPKLMLLLSIAGMLAGLWWDQGSALLSVLASICTTGAAPDLLAIAALHAQWLPWMHTGMVSGGLLAIPMLRTVHKCGRRQVCGRFLQNLTCSAWMVAGMGASALGVHQLTRQAGSVGSAAMLCGMLSGMVLGMIVSVTTYRIYFRLQDRYLGHTPSPL